MIGVALTGIRLFTRPPSVAALSTFWRRESRPWRLGASQSLTALHPRRWPTGNAGTTRSSVPFAAMVDVENINAQFPVT